MHNATELQQKLDAYIRRYYLNEFLRGGLFALGLGLSAFLLFTFSEYLGRFERPVRAALFYSLLLGNAALLGYYVVRPILALYRLRRRMSYSEAALKVGAHFDGIGDRLINALQLQDMLNTEGNSRELLLASIEQRTQQLSPFAFHRAVDFSVSRKRIPWLLIPASVLALVWIAQPEAITQGSERLFNYQQVYLPPPPYQVKILNSSLSTPAHQDFELQIKLSGNELPEVLFLHLGGAAYRMTEEAPQVYSYMFKNPSRDMNFFFSSGDHQTGNYTLSVLPRPMLLNMKVRLDYPSYLNMQDEEVLNPQDLTVPAGTKLDWEMLWKDARQIWLYWTDSIQHMNPNAENKIRFSRRALQSFVLGLKAGNERFRQPDSALYSVRVIPDAYPEIQVESVADSLALSRILFLGQAKDDHGLSRIAFYYSSDPNLPFSEWKRVALPVLSRDPLLSFQHPVDLGSLGFNLGDQLSYCFVVWDNDGVNGPKSARTPVVQHRILSREEVAAERKEASEQIQKGMQEQLKELESLKEQSEKLKRDLLNQKNPGWQEKQQLKALLEQRMKLQEEMQKFQEKQKENNLRNENISKTEQSILDKQKKIEELLDELKDSKVENMLKQLEQLMDKISKEELKKMMDQLEMSNEQVERELDRTLELFKQFEVEQRLQEAIQQMEELAKKQEALEKDKSQDNASKAEKQAELKKEAEALEKQMKELDEKNKELEKPNDLELPKEDEMQDIEQEMNDAQEELQKNQPEKASPKQKSAAQKMKKMAQKMKEQQQSMASAQQGENMEDLRALLDNVLQLSFSQEALLDQHKNGRQSDGLMRDVLRKQRGLATDARQVEDSLIALSKRVPDLENVVMDELLKVRRGMQSAIEAGADRMYPTTASRQQEAMTGLNNLALMLSEALDQMQQQMNSMGSSGGSQCNKPGNSKPEQMQEMIKRQLGLQKKMEEMQKKMQEKKEGEKNDKQGKPGQGEGGKGGEQSKKLAQMAAEQEQIRRQMEEMMKDMGEDGRKSMAEMMKKMEETERDILNKQINAQTLLRQQEITRRMMESEKALRKQDQDEKRESNENLKDWKLPEQILEEYRKRREHETEFLRFANPAFKPYYKQRVSEYFNSTAP